MAAMSQSAYARHLGVSRQAVSDAAKRGRITLVRGKCDPDRNDAEWGRLVVPSMPAADQKFPTYAESRTARAAFDAALARLEFERRKGELLVASDVSTAWHELISTAKSKLLLLGDELGDRLAAEADPIRCRELVNAEVRSALTALSNYKAA